MNSSRDDQTRPVSSHHQSFDWNPASYNALSAATLVYGRRGHSVSREMPLRENLVIGAILNQGIESGLESDAELGITLVKYDAVVEDTKGLSDNVPLIGLRETEGSVDFRTLSECDSASNLNLRLLFRRRGDRDSREPV